ncbi:MAG TPA: hypothetical protein VHO50_07170 [Bacteroidales bacterium]|nr:hypothetical protein [Bacteroidales bacterium]
MNTIFNSDRKRDLYIRNTIDNVKQFHELRIDHEGESKDSPLGEIGYLTYELSKVRSEGRNKGGITAYWIKYGCRRFKTIEKTVAQLMDEHKEEIERDFGRFDEQLRKFLLVYFQWENLTTLLNKVKKRSDDCNLLNIFNTEMQGFAKVGLRNLDRLLIRSEIEWNKSEFVGVCYCIYNAESQIKDMRYIDQQVIKFERFKIAMSQFFNRETPTHNLQKAKICFNEMDSNKQQKIKQLFT